MMRRKSKYLQLAHFFELFALQGNRRHCRTAGQGQTSSFQKPRAGTERDPDTENVAEARIISWQF